MPGTPETDVLSGDIRSLVQIVRLQVQRIDGLLAHFTAIDADYVRLREVVVEHNDRLAKVERHLNIEPDNKIGDSSALYPSVKLKG